MLLQLLRCFSLIRVDFLLSLSNKPSGFAWDGGGAGGGGKTKTFSAFCDQGRKLEISIQTFIITTYKKNTVKALFSPDVLFLLSLGRQLSHYECASCHIKKDLLAAPFQDSAERRAKKSWAIPRGKDLSHASQISEPQSKSGLTHCQLSIWHCLTRQL